MLRTLWVSTDFPPRSGGIEAFLGQLVARRDPAATRVLTARWPGAVEHDAAVAYRVERVGRRPLLPGPRLRALIRRQARAFGADVVVFGAAWPLGEAGASLNQPTVAITHGHEAGMARVGLGPLVARVARRVDALSVISEFTAAALGPWTGATPVHRLSPGVDTTVFHPAVDGGAIRARYGIRADQPLVVCVSRLVARKGQDVLVEAWPQVRAWIRGARLLLVGTGPAEPRLRRRIRGLGLAAAVTLCGEVPGAELPAHHAAADLFAMPCRTRYRGLDVEGLGIVYLEAQACGVPVVAGRSGGAPEALLDGVSGLTVDGASPAATAEAIAVLLADEGRRRRMGAAGRAFVERQHAWPVVSARLDAILRSVAGARDSRARGPIGSPGRSGEHELQTRVRAGSLPVRAGRERAGPAERAMMSTSSPSSSALPAAFRAFVAERRDERVDRGLRELSAADLPAGDVTVRVAYSSVNYKDGLATIPKGRVARISPLVPGIDLAGEIIEGGEALGGPGTLVLVHGYDLGVAHHGGYAEYARVPTDWVVPLPEGLDPRQAMAIGTAGFTAALSLHQLEARGLAPGDGPVLVTGASGGLGSVAVGILATRGYEVVASSGKADAADWLRELGAAEVIGREEVIGDPGRPLERERWAAAVDCVGGATLAGVLKALNYGAAVAASGNTGGPELATTIFPFILRGVALLGVDSVACDITLRRRLWQRLASDLRPRGLDESIAREIGLDELEATLDALLAGRGQGRTVVRVSAG